MHPHAGGVDIGDLVNVGCAPGGPDHPGMVALKHFPTHTQGCRELIDWLKGHGVESVAMESTGVLWVPFLELAEAAGLTRRSWSAPSRRGACRARRRPCRTPGISAPARAGDADPLLSAR
jgi:hypothetical protein